MRPAELLSPVLTHGPGAQAPGTSHMKTLSRSFFAGLAFVAVVTTANAQVSVFPATPRPQELVFVHVASLPINSDSFDSSKRTIVMSSNKITIELGTPDATFPVPPPGPTPPLTMGIGQFPSGTYQVEVRRQLGSSGSTESVGTATFSVAPSSASVKPLENYSDLWWNPDESGWGFNLVQHGSGIIFATWFNYAPDGRATWYAIPEGQWVRPTEYHGPIYRTTGPQVAETFNPASVTRTLAGSAVLMFSPFDSSRMTAVLTLDGTTITKLLQRQGF